MARPSVVVVVLAMVGALGGLVYVHVTRDGPEENNATTPRAATPARAETARSATAQPAIAAPTGTPLNDPDAAPAQPSSAQFPATDDVERWIAATRSNDPKARAAAIQALANAPVSQALPALERVLESGEPHVDRQIALHSLRALALNDGDDNGAIRDAIRYAIYHSDDEGVMQSAQAVLDDIEAEFATRVR